MAGYYPITLSFTDDGFIRSVVGRCADRFAKLNGARPRIISKPPEGAPPGVHPAFYKAWIWDIVPDNVDRVMYLDYDIVPLRPLGEIPDCLFGACSGHP